MNSVVLLAPYSITSKVAREGFDDLKALGRPALPQLCYGQNPVEALVIAKI